MRWSKSLAIGAIGVTVLTGCRSKPQAAQVGSVSAATTVALRPFNGDPAVAREGRVLFLKNNCYSCHGGLAGGAMGPSLRDTVWKYGGTDAAIYNSIHDGRPLGMPIWASTLTPDQMRALVVYIKSLRTSAEPKFFWAPGTDTAPGAAP
jgi:cbb3-type cytochrome c oxidase subunit III